MRHVCAHHLCGIYYPKRLNGISLYGNNQVQIEGLFPNHWLDLSTNINAEKDENGKEVFDTETKNWKNWNRTCGP